MKNQIQIQKLEALTVSDQGKLKGGFSIILNTQQSLVAGNNTKCIVNSGCKVVINKCALSSF